MKSLFLGSAVAYSSTFNPSKILDMIENKPDVPETDQSKQPWQMDDDSRPSNLDGSTLAMYRSYFVRGKGFYEGIHKGFYRNSALEYVNGQKACLGDESYRSLDMLAKGWDGYQQGDWSDTMLGITAAVHLVLDNESNCKFDRVLLDATTFCFVNDCGMLKVVGNISNEAAEAFYAFNMIWTTLLSSDWADTSLEAYYTFYHSIGENSGILLDDLLGYRPRGGFKYDT